MELRLNMTTGEKTVGGVDMTNSHIRQEPSTQPVTTMDSDSIMDFSTGRKAQVVPTLEHQAYPVMQFHKDPTDDNIYKALNEFLSQDFDPDTATSKELILHGAVLHSAKTASSLRYSIKHGYRYSFDKKIIHILMNKYMDTLRDISNDEFGLDEVRYIEHLIFDVCKLELERLNAIIRTIMAEATMEYEIPDIKPDIDYTINSIKDIIVINTDSLGYLGDNEPAVLFKDLYETIHDYIDIYTQLYNIIVKGINTKV